MYLSTWLVTALTILVTIDPPKESSTDATKDDALSKVGGTWLYVEDRTKGRPVEQQGPPMSMKFRLRVEKDGVVYPRPRGDERITLDGSVVEKKEGDDFVARYFGVWKKKEGWLEYTLERVRLSDNEKVFILKRVFRPTDEGLLVYVFSNKFKKQVALYRHPEDIELPKPAKATIADMSWLAGAWEGKKRMSSTEERWSPPKGGAMLGVARTVKEKKMTGFEFLRIVERDGGLVYIAQPGGKSPTEFVLTELKKNRAVFLNPRHDFPQRIVYELSKEGVLTTGIGFANGGRLRSSEFKREGN